MELKCQLVIRMACNSGFAFTDGKGTLTKIAFSSSSSGLRLTGSSSMENTETLIVALPHPCLPRWLVGAPTLPFPKRARLGGRFVGQGQGERAANHTSCKNGRAKSPLKTHPPSYFVFFLVSEILKVTFKGICVPKNLQSLAFLEIAI